MNIGDISTLKKVIENISISSATLIAEDVMGNYNYIDNLFNFLMVKGDEYKSPSDYYDSFSTKWNVLWRSGFRVGSALLRDKMITELVTRNLMGGELYISLKEKRSNESDPDSVEAGVEALSKAFAARVFMKRSGLRYDQLTRDTTNGYIAGSLKHPFTVEEAHRRIEYYVPPVSSKPKYNQNLVIGQQHFIGTKQGEFLCFRCERGKPEYVGVKICAYDTKTDGSAVNSQEVIDAKFREIKAAKRKRNKQKADKEKEEDKLDNHPSKEMIKGTGSQHIVCN